jgi:acyl-coenzyme A synthetase/AMP-(fatty) acid ligase
MSKLLIDWLNTGPENQQLISFNNHDIITGQAFCAQVAYLHGQLLTSSAQRWLLASKNSQLFAAGLCAAILAGKRLVLPANTQPGTLTELTHEFDAIMTDVPLTLNKPEIRLKKELSLPNMPWPKASSLGELQLFTSGSSGQPKAVRKTLVQLDAEVSELESTFATHLPHCAIVSTVSHQHIYGLLFKILWPLASSRPFLSEQIKYPETLSYYLALMPNLCLISSPAHLARLPDALANQVQQGKPSLIFSSGGPLSFSAAQGIKHCYQQLPIEVFGSTETGGIAYRGQSEPDQAWQAFKRVKVDADPLSGALMLQSDYLEDPQQWLTCADKVELLGENRFRLLHRLDRIVKIEEKRLSLVQMEQLLTSHPWVCDSIIVSLEQPRKMLGAALVLTALGQKHLEEQGKLSINNDLKQHLLSQFERVTLPRRWRYLADLPHNSEGKRIQADLVALFNHD